MKAVVLLALLAVACSTPPEDEVCKDAALEAFAASKGRTWCPVDMQIELLQVDSAGNALCTYVSQCGDKFQISGCAPSMGITCVGWMQLPEETDRLTEVSATKGER